MGKMIDIYFHWKKSIKRKQQNYEKINENKRIYVLFQMKRNVFSYSYLIVEMNLLKYMIHVDFSLSVGLKNQIKSKNQILQVTKFNFLCPNISAGLHLRRGILTWSVLLTIQSALPTYVSPPCKEEVLHLFLDRGSIQLSNLSMQCL